MPMTQPTGKEPTQHRVGNVRQKYKHKDKMNNGARNNGVVIHFLYTQIVLSSRKLADQTVPIRLIFISGI